MFPPFYRAVLLPSVRFLQGKKELEFLAELERSQYLGRDELANLQLSKASALMTHAISTVPYYGEVMKRLDFNPSGLKSLDEIERLPFLTKKIIRENKDRLVSSSFSPKDLIPDSTGGSTGEFVWYNHDKRKIDRMAAAAYRSYRWCGLDVGMKWAKLWGSPREIATQARLKRRIAQAVKNEMFLPCYELTEDTMGEYLGRLKKFRPSLIEGYTSVLFFFALYMKRNGITPPETSALVATAESVSSLEREVIEENFHAPVFNKYGSRELGHIAMECGEHNGLHINMERMIVECIKDGSPAKPGEAGEIVVTDLDTFGMPFIRYRTGDLGMLTGRQCRCGRGLAMIENLYGRTMDIIVTQEGKLLPGLFLATVFRHSGVVERFQVHQTADGRLNVKLIPNKKFGPGSLKILETSLRSYVGDRIAVSFELVDDIPPALSGKLKIVTSDIPPDFSKGELSVGNLP